MEGEDTTQRKDPPKVVEGPRLGNSRSYSQTILHHGVARAVCRGAQVGGAYNR